MNNNSVECEVTKCTCGLIFTFPRKPRNSENKSQFNEKLDNHFRLPGHKVKEMHNESKFVCQGDTFCCNALVTLENHNNQCHQLNSYKKFFKKIQGYKISCSLCCDDGQFIYIPHTTNINNYMEKHNSWCSQHKFTYVIVDTNVSILEPIEGKVDKMLFDEECQSENNYEMLAKLLCHRKCGDPVN